MTSTLEEGLSSGRSIAQDALDKRSEELDAEEADIAESRVRYEVERLLDFYDELSDTKVRFAQFNIDTRHELERRSPKK